MEHENERYILYHKEKAPEGREFNTADHGPPEYWAKQGWVDNPAKHGINIWGPDHEQAVHVMHERFKQGKVGPLDKQVTMTEEGQAEIDQLQREIADRDERIRQQDDLITQMSRSKEEYNDAVSDADKERVNRPEAQVPVPGDITGPGPDAGPGDGEGTGVQDQAPTL